MERWEVALDRSEAPSGNGATASGRDVAAGRPPRKTHYSLPQRKQSYRVNAP